MRTWKQLSEIKPGDLVWGILTGVWVVLDNKFMGLSAFDTRVYLMTNLDKKGNVVQIINNSDKGFDILQ